MSADFPGLNHVEISELLRSSKLRAEYAKARAEHAQIRAGHAQVRAEHPLLQDAIFKHPSVARIYLYRKGEIRS